MPDSQDQPRRGSREAHFPVARTNNRKLPAEPTLSGDTSTLDPDGLGFDEWIERNKQLIGLRAEEAQLRLLDSVADLAEAHAEEAGHQAAAEPARQKMSLWERAVKLFSDALLTLTVIGLAIAILLVSPWLSLGLPLTAVAAWRRFGHKGEDHRPPADDEGDP